MSSRKILCIIGGIAFCCMIAALFLYRAPSVKATDESETPTVKTADTITSDTKTTRLSGKGRQASEKFQLEPGLSTFEISHDGDSNFVVRLLDENGKEVDTLFNHIGPLRAKRGFEIRRAGQHLLDIVSNGNWSVDIDQPRPTQAAAPTVLRGTGNDMSDFVRLEKGLNVFKIKHKGSDRFKVILLDQDGREIESLVNTLGSFDGSKPVTIDKSGIYALNISGDGEWTIDVE